MNLIKLFRLTKEYGGKIYQGETIVVGTFKEMINTWLDYLSIPFKEGNNVKFFDYLNRRQNLKTLYRFDGLGRGEHHYFIRHNYFVNPFLSWKYLFFPPYDDYLNDEHFNRIWIFYDSLNCACFPSIFDYLFNIQITEIDEIHYLYYELYTYNENNKVVNFVEYLIMRLRGQIV